MIGKWRRVTVVSGLVAGLVVVAALGGFTSGAGAAADDSDIFLLGGSKSGSVIVHVQWVAHVPVPDETNYFGVRLSECVRESGQFQTESQAPQVSRLRQVHLAAGEFIEVGGSESFNVISGILSSYSRLSSKSATLPT